MSLFAVIASSGAYSDRVTWLAGIFETRAQAENIIKECVERRGAIAAFWSRRHLELAKLTPEGNEYGRPVYSKAQTDAAYAAAGEYPAGANFEEGEIKEIEIGVTYAE